MDVTTRNEIYAGTDDEVYVEIVGQNNGSTGPLILASPSAANISNTFEPGVTSLFRLEATDVGEVSVIILYCIGRNKNGTKCQQQLSSSSAVRLGNSYEIETKQRN